MNTHWLHKKGADKCILFMSGWGADYNPFLPLNSVEYDVYMCYDYRNILQPKEVKRLFENYQEVYLVAWSLGVWVSNLILNQWKELFKEKIAINGTLNPINSEQGIPPAIFQGTIQQFNEKGRQKFFMRMCGNRDVFQNFQEHKPERELVEQKEELVVLKDTISSHTVEWNLFEKALIGSEDRIFPPQNMENAWRSKVEIFSRDLPHFCFYQWESWDEFIKDFSENAG